MNKRIILLNGPINCGKGFIAKALINRLGGTEQEFKEKLYVATSNSFGVDLEWFKGQATDRILKEKRCEKLVLVETEYSTLCKFLGKKPTEKVYPYCISPREAMIFTSEVLMKPTYGDDYFGIATAKGMVEGNNYVSDSGFKEEAAVQVEQFGRENVLLIRIHRDGCEFSSQDSRDYINLNDLGVATLDLDNNHDIEEVVNTIADFMYVNLGKEC